MKTFFAPPHKAGKEKLTEEITFASSNPVISGLLHSLSGLLAVLNEQRQIVALNDELLQMLEVDDPATALGLRPGEAFQCVHAHEEPAGCGTTQFCSTCGAAIAIMLSLKENKPVERVCTLSSGKKDVADIVLMVRSQPIQMENERFLLLFIQDISKQQRRVVLDRTFFHDISNILGILSGASELLARDDSSILAQTVYQTTQRLIREVTIQRYLLQHDSFNYQPMWDNVTADRILEELRSFFANHPAVQKKSIAFPENYPNISVNTDISLLLRVLCNIIINALEATETDTAVKVRLEHTADALSFFVWNAQEISQEAAQRMFQLNFSTKATIGRGIGTYSMKLLGEKILGGKVSFTTSAEEGTTFRFTIPVQQA